MIKNKKLLVITCFCFVIVNTIYFWDSFLGALFFPLLLVFLITLALLFILLFRQIYFIIKEKFADRGRIYSALGVAILLGLIVYQPSGIVDFEEMEGKSVFNAWYKGVAGCASNLKLTADHKYYVRQVCFGIEHLSGTYIVIDDTIKFKPSSPASINHYFDFGILKEDSAHSCKKGRLILQLYKTAKDTLPASIMQISQNELIK